MILGQTVDHVIERIQTGGSEYSDLAHASSEHLSPPLGLCNLRVGPHQDAPSRGAEALGNAEGQCVGAGCEIFHIRPDAEGGIEDSSAIDANRHPPLPTQPQTSLTRLHRPLLAP